MTDLQNKPVKTRKNHWCEWCGERIDSGQQAQYRAYVFDGDFISSWQHPECFAAMNVSDRMELAEGWEFGGFERGKQAGEHS
jgi:hypothetical protein